ncbi:MAG: hypothetical protein JOY99_01605 [Sphingomonadaceae bacterium]|nr:hypothetical protein [Sphingomonadaceae bacterium]
MTPTWTEALEAYQRATSICEAIDAEQHVEAFDEAARRQGVVIEAALQAPAPDLAAVATKLQIMHRDGYQHMLAQVLADVERLAGGPPSTATAEAPWGSRDGKVYRLPAAFPGVSDAVKAAFAGYRAAYFARGDNAGEGLSAAAAAIAQIPVRSLSDLAAKVLMGALESSPGHRGDQLVVDLNAMSTDGAADILLACADDALRLRASAEDPRLAEAFEAYRSALWALKVPIDDLSDEAAAPFYAQMDPADVAMKTVPAITTAGVIMKLKRVFVAFAGEQWSDHAVFDGRPTDFDTHVQNSDLYQEMFWRAIEDLERIAGSEVRS